MILVVDRKGSELGYRGGCLRLQSPEQPARRIPIEPLECVIVYGNPLVETAVWRHLTKAGVPAVIMSTRGQDGIALLGTSISTSLNFRRAQHRLAGHARGRRGMAAYFLRRKFQASEAAAEFLLPDTAARRRFDERLRLARQRLEDDHDMPVASLRGLEGSVAAVWFSALADCLPPCWGFSGRNRRPPRDPVNALLSLSYTLLYAEARQLLLASGLDPSLGFLHSDYPGREGLVLDFIEAFRPAVDLFVARLLGRLESDRKTAFYYRRDIGCRLSKSARAIYYPAWAEYRQNWPVLDRDAGGSCHLRQRINAAIADLKQQIGLLDEH